MRIYGVAVIVVQPDKKRFLVKKYTRRKYTVRFFQWKEAWFLKKYFVYFKNLLRPVASNCKFRWISFSTRVCISRHGQHHFICFFAVATVILLVDLHYKSLLSYSIRIIS